MAEPICAAVLFGVAGHLSAQVHEVVESHHWHTRRRTDHDSMLMACYSDVVGAIQVKNVPAELHEAIRRRAASEGVDLQDYVLQVLRRDLGLPSQREWLDELHRQPDAIGVPPATDVLDDERRRRHGADRH